MNAYRETSSGLFPDTSENILDTHADTARMGAAIIEMVVNIFAFIVVISEMKYLCEIYFIFILKFF
jgi:hypothetical protein